MFDTLLIANRGEIACRVIRSAKARGLRCVAVYSDADRDALHVRLADAAVRIGGAAPADSYLRGDRIIDAALETGAGAIHPGYGFLSENPDFVEAVEQAGLVFVGPSAQAIRAMGLKDRAKALMEKAVVPVVPGYHGSDQSDARLRDEAARVGYPVMLKAVAGGGGKGMRIVAEAAGLDEALASARAEAGAAFGNTDMLIEKYIETPRHIEVQVFGDGERAVHLFERDCSLQRRHQKVIEEAPAPGMTDAVRTAMGAAAVRAAEAIGYKGAGTVEFIVDGAGGLRPDGFWFMEMNTRLQVEHPVTELVTGVDLVDWQLRVAAGEPLPAAQEDLALSGHAFEARLYAEDVPAGFLPATGRLAHLDFPDGVRADSGVAAGDEITPYYDPMIAKLVVHGADRESALAALLRGLSRTQVAGTVTNLAFLKALALHAGFAAGEVDTGLIARDIDALTEVPAPGPQVIAQAVVTLAEPGQGFTLWAPLHRRIETSAGPCTLIMEGPDSARVIVADQQVRAIRQGGSWRFDGQAAWPAVRHGNAVTVFDEATHEITLVDLLERAAYAGALGDTIEAPMPGLLREMAVAEGQQVAEGDRLAVLEAMKMEHVLRAPRDGCIARIGVQAGAQVAAGTPLIELEKAET